MAKTNPKGTRPDPEQRRKNEHSRKLLSLVLAFMISFLAIVAAAYVAVNIGQFSGAVVGGGGIGIARTFIKGVLS